MHHNPTFTFTYVHEHFRPERMQVHGVCAGLPAAGPEATQSLRQTSSPVRSLSDRLRMLKALFDAEMGNAQTDAAFA